MPLCAAMTCSACHEQVLREKVFRRLYKELPYLLELQDVSCKTLPDGSLRIEKDIMVPTDQVQAPLQALLKGPDPAACWPISAGCLSCPCLQSPPV